MNRQITAMLGVTEEDYKKWCAENKRASYRRSSKEEYARYLLKDAERKEKLREKKERDAFRG